MQFEGGLGDADTISRWLAQRSTHASADVRMRVPPEVRGTAPPEPIDDDPAVDDRQFWHDVDAREAGAAVLGAVDDSNQRARPAPADRERPARRQTPRQRQQTSDATYAARSTSVVFPQRNGVRRLLGALVLVMVAAAAGAGAVAYTERTEPTALAAIGLAVLALVVWGARAAAAPTSVRLEHGLLEVRRAGRVETADLANARTPIVVVGSASSRRWRVLIERANEPLLVVDRSMVDPVAFTAVLYHVHPQLWSEPGAVLEPWQLR